MTRNLGVPPQPRPLATDIHHPLLPDARTGFATHKYLMVAILKCLQERHPRRTAPTPGQRGDPTVHRWMREPSAERETTPCIVLREHHDRHNLSVGRLRMECVDLKAQGLAGWMRAAVPASSLPDRDTVHLAMAPTLPGVPVLVHSTGAEGEAFTHLFTEGVWSLAQDHQFLFRAIRHAQLVATAVPLGSLPAGSNAGAWAGTAPLPEADADLGSCDLVALGRRFDHIAVHAALGELSDFRRNQRRVRAGPPGGSVVSNG